MEWQGVAQEWKGGYGAEYGDYRAYGNYAAADSEGHTTWYPAVRPLFCPGPAQGMRVDEIELR